MSASLASTKISVRPLYDPITFGLGCFEIIVGLGALLLADYVPIFDLLAVVAGLLGVFALIYCIVNPESLKVYDLFGAILLFGYGSGALNTVASLYLDHQEITSPSATAQYWLTQTLALVLCVCGFIHLIGRLDGGGYLLRLGDSNRKEATRVMMFVVPIFLLYVALLATGRIGFMATVSDDGGKSVSPIAVFALLLATPAGALALSVALRISRSAFSLGLIAISILLLLLQFGLGRRTFVFSAVIYLLCILLVKRPKKLISFKNIVMLAAAMLAVYIVTMGFYAMRLAAWSMSGRGNQNYSVMELIPKAIEVYSQDRRGRLEAKSAKNVKMRTFVLEYLSEISKGVSEREPLYGEDLHRALIVATPSLFYPSKIQDNLFEPEEPLINPAFGLPVFDGPNSILTAGAADFGVVGMFLYPFVFCVTLSALLRGAYRYAPPIVGLLFGLFICQLVLNVETDIAQCLASLRSIIPVVLIAWFYFSVGTGKATVAYPMRGHTNFNTPAKTFTPELK